MKILETLNWATHYLKERQIENPRLNAELLLARSMNLSREKLYLRFNHQIQKEERKNLESLIQRRISREPLQYILGHQEFWSIDFRVDPRVLIPRSETELLVEAGLSILSEVSSKRTPSVLELGTGCGAIAISLAKEVKDIFIVAIDVSMDALILAKENTKSAGGLDKIEFLNGDLFGPFHLFKEPFDLILSNPPYIMGSKIEILEKEVKDYEPIIALDGGEDGLKFYRDIIAQAPLYLRTGGWLLLEVGSDQSNKVVEMIEREGHFQRSEPIKDLSGIERVVKAQKGR